MTTIDPVTARISALNDLCRQAIGKGRRFTQTCGICDLSISDQLAIQEKVAKFAAFEADDTYGERDFGAFDHNGERIMWKIDYYHPSLEYGSEDPSDPLQTTRILTIMLAYEY